MKATGNYSSEAAVRIVPEFGNNTGLDPICLRVIERQVHNNNAMLASFKRQFATFEFRHFVPGCRCRDKNRFAWNGESKMPSLVGEDLNISICIPCITNCDLAAGDGLARLLVDQFTFQDASPLA
jgi:hypothetical protein